MPNPRLRAKKAVKAREEISSHLFIKKVAEVQKLIAEGVPRTEAEERVFGEFFRKRQK
jgi:hypothetical protein